MKNKLILIGLFLWLFYFVSYPQDAFAASCSGILLWFEQILPSLLPYSILSNIILSSGLFSTVGNSSAEIFVILCGLTFGFPIGSKLSADLCAKGVISPERAQLLAACTNNMSPAFVSNYVLTYCLNRTDLLVQTYLLLYGIPLAVAILGLCRLSLQPDATDTQNCSTTYHAHSSACADDPDHTSTSPGGYGYSTSTKKTTSRFHIDMQIIDAGITNSFETLIRLCGYIVIFSILAHIIGQLSFLSKAAGICLTGILEVTNGIGLLPTSGLPERVRYLMALGFLSFGGISGMAQTGSMITPAGLNPKEYCRTKLLLTILILSAAILYIELSGTPFY